jgi:undecaprenyl pyrophosphate phosphatase UppP
MMHRQLPESTGYQPSTWLHQRHWRQKKPRYHRSKRYGAFGQSQKFVALGTLRDLDSVLVGPFLDLAVTPGIKRASLRLSLAALAEAEAEAEVSFKFKLDRRALRRTEAMSLSRLLG